MIPENYVPIETRYGVVHIAANSDDRVRVVAGDTIGFGYGRERLECPPLTIRGVEHRVDGAVYLQPDGSWSPASTYDGKSYRLRIERFQPHIVGSTPATHAAERDLLPAIMEAVATYAAEHGDELERAGIGDREEDAARRDEHIGKLRAAIAALEAEAAALRAGGRTVEVEHRMSSGGHETCQHVRTVDGELLPAVPEIPRISGTSRYGH